MVQSAMQTELAQVEVVTMYRTADGELHNHESWARRHAETLVNVQRANEMLEAGATVAEAARVAGIMVPEGSVLERITAETPLIISHYQCRDTPGYKVCRINTDLSFFVHGNAGSWSGSYGCSESMSNVARYAERTLREEAATV